MAWLFGCLSLAAALGTPVRADDDQPLPGRMVIDVDSPERALYRIAVPNLLGGGTAATEGGDTLRNDLTLCSLFQVLDPRSFAGGQPHDTPVPVLAPGTGKTKLGRLWTYVRDDRPAGDAAAPAVWFAYSPDRKGEHPHRHLATFAGMLQADGYAGFNRLYDSGRIREAACWAHVRRKFFDIEQAHASPLPEKL